MNHGAITASLDIAQVVLYLFWGFFAALIIYLHRENQREGYPLETADRSPNKLQEGLGGRPQPKTYLLPHGGTKTVPAEWKAGPAEVLKARRLDRNPDSPLVPIGNPLLAGVGPGAWASRDDHPDLQIDGTPKIVPLSADTAYGVAKGDPDPRGKTVFGADGKAGGTCVDIWVDRSERLFRYYEIEVAGGAHVLLPANFAKVQGSGAIKVASILGQHFAEVPRTKQAQQITLLEEDVISAYYGAGTLYATPDRLGPLL
ncbi:photosynthetic reaction center subunit H [Nevskia ramosa]|uniref:photosynthetic reaction center subunit H n=1 Tax=Nevskia ramosa TaxID=64002 RepID=UPI002356526A|nr:photosynthetic reaction center subunit H [Nevskia ramosa]